MKIECTREEWRLLKAALSENYIIDAHTHYDEFICDVYEKFPKKLTFQIEGDFDE